MPVRTLRTIHAYRLPRIRQKENRSLNLENDPKNLNKSEERKEERGFQVFAQYILCLIFVDLLSI